MNKLDKLALGAVGVIFITNPASGQVILDGLDWIFQQIFLYGSPINFVASGVVFAYILFKMWDSRDKVNIPDKSAKTKKAGKMIIS